MSEIDKANAKLFISALETLRDSQFLGWLAMSMQERSDPLTDYCAKRLDLIALRVAADGCVNTAGAVEVVTNEPDK